MGKYLSAVREIVRAFLSDGFVSDAEEEFTNDELDLYIADCLVEISEHQPRQVKHTLMTVEGSRELDIGSESDVRILSFVSVGYTDCVDADLTLPVVGTTTNDSGVLVAYDNTRRQWWVRLDAATDEFDVAEAITITGGTGAGTTSAASVLGFDPAGLISVEKLEYKVDQSTQEFRNLKRWGDILTIDTELTPSADEMVYLYCHKVHELTETTSSLNPQLERILAMGAVAQAALGWINNVRKQLVAAISGITEVNTAIDSMSARITAAIGDLTTGRTYIAKKESEALTAIGNMSTRITQSINDLTSGRALIGSKKTEAIDAIDDVSTQVTLALNDLTTGRAQISDTRSDASTSIAAMSDRITQAITDLTSGRALINKVNIGGSPEDDYANYAAKELQGALTSLNQGRGYLSEITTADRYANYAARDFQAALTKLSQAKAYLSLDTLTQEYANYAARELNNATAYLNQGIAYLRISDSARDYATYAGREVANATACLNQAGGYIRELTARLSIANAMRGYQAWANDKLILYQRELGKITRIRTTRQYPKS